MAALTLALVQTPLVWQNPQENRNLLKAKIEKLFQVNKDFDLVVFPETFTTGFTMTPDQINYAEEGLTVSWMQYMARMYNTAICGSIIARDGDVFYNRFYFVHPDTKVVYYDKHQTFTLAGESKAYGRGYERVLISYKGFKIRPLICYDLRFPVWSRNDQDYDLLLYVANWPSPRIEAWDTLLKARAIENLSYVVGVNRIGEDPNGHTYPGHSSIYDPMGKQLSYSEKDGIIVGTLTKDHLTGIRSKFDFLADRDEFEIK